MKDTVWIYSNFEIFDVGWYINIHDTKFRATIVNFIINYLLKSDETANAQPGVKLK